LLVKRLGWPLLGFVLVLGFFALGWPESAFAQAGSTGGVIGKQDKSISGVALSTPCPPESFSGLLSQDELKRRRMIHRRAAGESLGRGNGHSARRSLSVRAA
jgi:hypothetical protein